MDNSKIFITNHLNILLANSYLLSLKIQNCHWNVKASNFFELHKFFENQYKELAEAIDEIAERIRAINEITPASFADFLKLTTLSENSLLNTAFDMIKALMHDNNKIIEEIKTNLTHLKDSDDFASIDLFVKRLGFHEKSLWMLKSMYSSTT